MALPLFDYTAFGYTKRHPNITDFITTMTTELGVSPSLVNENTPWANAALAFSVHWVYKGLAKADNAIYLRAVYCLALDRAILIAQDTPPDNTFSALRDKFKIYAFRPGVIAESHDESTGQSFNTPTSLNSLSIADLNNMKTPWGIEYLGYAQQASPIWGMS